MNSDKTIEKISPWLEVTFETSSHTTPQFAKFAREYKRTIKALLPEGCFIVNWSKRHFGCCGFIRSQQGYHVYIFISDVRYFPNEWFNNILIRTAKHEKDYTGGGYNYTDLEHFTEKVSLLFPKEEQK